MVGGTGPESTVMYYKELNSKIDAATGGKNMPEVAIESVNFRKAWELVSTGQYRELADYLSEKVKILDDGGAEIIALTAGTMHIVYDEIVNNTEVFLVSIPKAVCSEVIERGYKKVGLLGTIFTMEQDFMKKAYNRYCLSPRRYHKILKLARTAADLKQSPFIQIHHLASALNYTIFFNTYEKEYLCI